MPDHLGVELASHLAPAAARAGINLIPAVDNVPGAVLLIELLAAGLPAALADPARFSAGAPASFSLIAGPSKTGDIEAVMIRGVHGSGQVEVVLWG